MKTYYAPPERADDADIRKYVETVSKNPVIDGLMNIVSGLLAVLNEQRQILSLNETFLKMLGISEPGEVLGLRLGESIQCTHAKDMPGGCGTSEFCSTCGAAIATVASLVNNLPAERKCAIAVEKNGKQTELFFSVRSFPVTFGDTRLILLFLNEITKQQQWATIERVFFHDINNIVYGILGRSELLPLEEEDAKDRLAKEIFNLSLRLSKEIAIQRSLFQTGMATYLPVFGEVPISLVVEDIQQIYADHIASKNKRLVVSGNIPQLTLMTDISLLTRILCNMITNAFEATGEGEPVKLSVETDKKRISFCVWNSAPIPDTIAKRVFQRNFSTKEGMGRGLGTYSMKFFGEKILGGEVDFTTSESAGTMFCFSLRIG